MRISQSNKVSTTGRRAPLPVGPFSGRRKPWRRLVSRLCATVDRAVEALPVGRWFRRRIHDRLELSHHDIRLSRGGSGLDGLTVAVLTDLHIGCNMDAEDLVRIFDRVAAEEPDLVCLVGDLINSRDREVLALREPLQRLRPPLGVYAVPGNHDHFFGRDVSLWRAFLSELGVKVLLNQGCRVEWKGASLWVAGVDDLTEGDPDLARALSGADDREPVLLLTHHPDFFFEAAAVSVDLSVAGHTHGGQIRLWGRYPLKHTRFGWWEGLFSEEGAQLYVSRGVGVTLLPLRIGVPPEIPLLRLVREGATSGPA